MKNKLMILLVIGFLLISFVPSISAIVTVPDPPENLTATNIGNHDYELDWDAPANDGGAAITGYRIEIAAVNTYGTESTHWSLLTITEDATTNYTHEQTAAYSYCYRVFAINSEGTSLPSNYDNCWTAEAEVSSSIYGLDLTAVSDSQIDLSWDEPNDNGLPITGYKIEYKVNDVEYTLTEDTGTTDTSYSHTGLVANTNYYYKVYALNGLGPSNSQDWESIKTIAGPAGVPGSPVNLRVYPDYGSNELWWDAPDYDGGSDIIGYKIEYNISGGDWVVAVENTGNTDTVYNHDVPENCVLYYYRVYAINDIGTGIPSNEDLGKPNQFDDYDCDGIDNVHDNCPDHSNPDQADQDNDGVGDKCDNCRFKYNPTQEDDDEDQIGNVCDTEEGSPTGAPGFELLIMIFALFVILIYKKKKQ